MSKNQGLTMALAMDNHGLTRPQTKAKPINKIKRNKRRREASHASRITPPHVNATSNSFFGSFFVGFVENLAGATHGGA